MLYLMSMKNTLLAIFKELDEWMEAHNADLEAGDAAKLRPIEVQVLGQLSLLANDVVANVLTLQSTNDLDARLRENDWNIKRILNREILPKYGLNLDSQSEDIWVAPGHKFELLHDFKNVRVKLLDAESALVSKAVKAKEKNRVLIIDAIASGEFPNLVQRIEDNGGDLEYFVGDENEDG